MPVNQITDPGAYSTETAAGAITTAVFQATGSIAKGAVVQLVTGFTGTGPLLVKTATTTANKLIVGVALTAASTGTLVQVVTNGPVQALCNTNTVKAEAVLQTTTTAGYVKTAATGILGETLGVSLETVTSVAVHLIWIYVSRM